MRKKDEYKSGAKELVIKWIKVFLLFFLIVFIGFVIAVRYGD